MKSSEIIIFFPSIEKGGADNNLFMISNFLAKKLDKVSILTCSSKHKIKFKNIKYIGPNSNIFDNLGRGLKTIIALYYLIKVIIIKKKILVLSFQSNISSILICKIFSTKIITRSNSFPNDCTNSFLKKWIFKVFYNLADKIIVNSLQVKKKFKKIYNLNSIHIYNPIDKSKILSRFKYKHKKSFNIMDSPAHGACSLINKKNYLKIGGYNKLFDRQDGYYLWILMNLNNLKILHLQKPLFFYRKHGKNLSNDKLKILKTRIKIILYFLYKKNVPQTFYFSLEKLLKQTKKKLVN